MKLKTSTIYTVLLLFIMFAPVFLHAQQGPGFGDDVDEAPIDGGLSLLVAAGIGYGAKKLRKKPTKKEA